MCRSRRPIRATVAPGRRGPADATPSSRAGMGWCHGFGTERAAARREPAHPQYASGAGDLLASRSRAFRDEARCWSEDDDPPRDERATSPSASASASAFARSPLRALDAAVDLRELRASLDAHRRAVPDAGGGRGALVCGPSPDVVVTLGSRAWTPSRSSKPSRRWSDPRRTPAPWARARPRRPHPRAVVVVLNPARARTPSRRPPRDAPRTHPSSRRPFERPRTSPPVDGRTGTTLAHPSSRAARRTTRTLDDDAPTTLPSLSSRSAPHPSISLSFLSLSLCVSPSLLRGRRRVRGAPWRPARRRAYRRPRRRRPR